MDVEVGLDVDDDVIDRKQINSKKQVRVPDAVLNGLDAEPGDILLFVENEEDYGIEKAEITR